MKYDSNKEMLNNYIGIAAMTYWFSEL